MSLKKIGLPQRRKDAKFEAAIVELPKILVGFLLSAGHLIKRIRPTRPPRWRYSVKSDVEKLIEPRVAAAFEDILAETSPNARKLILQNAEQMVRAVWTGKIYAALPKDRTTVPEYFLDAELDQFLNEAIEACHAKITSIAEQTKEES